MDDVSDKSNTICGHMCSTQHLTGDCVSYRFCISENVVIEIAIVTVCDCLGKTTFATDDKYCLHVNKFPSCVANCRGWFYAWRRISDMFVSYLIYVNSFDCITIRANMIS